MTFYLEDKYPNRVYPPSAGYIRGSFKNRTSPDSQDGTFLEEEWKNDERAFQEAILINAKVKPNGRVDTGIDSQVYDGLISIINNMISTGTQTLYGKASGSSDAITVNLPRSISLNDGVVIYVRANYSNKTTKPTLKVGNLQAKAIIKGNNLPLNISDIAGAGFVMHLVFDKNFDRWVLLNPATGVIVPESIPVGTLAYMARTGDIDGWLFVDGREHQREQYERFVQSCPQFIMNGSTSETFRLIDLRGYFLRTLDSGKGVDVDRSFGSLQGDAIRNITGTFGHWDATINPKTGAFTYADVGTNKNGASGKDYFTRDILFDASKVVPVSSENRPKNYAFPLYVKV